MSREDDGRAGYNVTSPREIPPWDDGTRHEWTCPYCGTTYSFPRNARAYYCVNSICMWKAAEAERRHCQPVITPPDALDADHFSDTMAARVLFLILAMGAIAVGILWAMSCE